MPKVVDLGGGVEGGRWGLGKIFLIHSSFVCGTCVSVVFSRGARQRMKIFVPLFLGRRMPAARRRVRQDRGRLG